MLHDYFEGRQLAECPSNSSDLPVGGWLHYPGSFSIFVTTAITALVFSIVTMVKFNSVRVFNRRIRTDNISNNFWVAYFLAMTARCDKRAVDAARYANFDDETTLDAGLFISNVVLHGVVSLLLGLALNHQFKHRSATPPQVAASATNKLPEVNSTLARVKDTVVRTETCYYAAFLGYLITTLMMTIYPDSKVCFWVYVVFMWAQRLLIWGTTIRIISKPTLNVEGPSPRSKIYLAVAGILNVLHDEPATLLQAVLPVSCPFYVFSGVDFVLLLALPSLALFFAFLKTEYERNMEECIWTTVSQIQDTFDYRRF
ncbi:hypothetical protein CAOG_08820 [Capsaspora owczarzaki ATCC 30864]|uniref:Transmembrane protein n=1 Tax=Capsaspora owczarzaki (strain ATCC 30864) TaxID=595528 RepID=A0A0D2VSJ4_CAPO3|nr:hypothetical protein CAOG_08820 [Capsaspora owczarzaki ATCC 30864]KJE94072.1 hypothetical protein CAOG_008820 [Capsaspora owczarzaki ATCC 30864]|eukprot:XP_011270460.1 hypothetical protein CAOG_08820 [Capsaspora owczarzaki ATCC 30864]